MPTLTHGYDMQAEMTMASAMTLELLHRAVDNINPDGYEGIPFSDGMGWIWKRPQAFLELLHAEGVSVEDFFRPHLGNTFIGSMLHQPWLVLALGDDTRTSFVRELLMASSHCDDRWLGTALACGVSRDDLAEMILAKLAASPIDPNSNCVDFVEYNFLHYGAGSVDILWSNKRRFRSEEATYWSILTDEQLVQAMWIVIEAAPCLLFGVFDINNGLGLADRLAIRLGDEQVAVLLEEAMSRLEDLSNVYLKVFERLSSDVQLRTARRLMAAEQSVSSFWVASMALQMGSENGGLELLKEFRSTFQDSITDYRQWCRKAHSQAGLDQVIVTEVERLMRTGLEKAGWVVAELDENRHKDRTQLCVRVGRGRDSVLYIKDSYQTTYRVDNGSMSTFPEKGDIVAFRPEHARSIHHNGRICVTSFTPLWINR
jgi:hypothetical protein